MPRISSLAAMFVIGFTARALAGHHRATGSHGWRRHRGRRYGRDHGHWHGEVPEPFRSVLERWHREAHAAD